MSHFLQLLSEIDKAEALATSCNQLRQRGSDSRHFEVASESFDAVPGSPFSYWVSNQLRETFQHNPSFESNGRTAKVGLQTSDNFRFLRLYWEIVNDDLSVKWFPYAKGGVFSPYYSDLHLLVLWASNGMEAKAWAESLYGGGQHWSRRLQNVGFLFRPGITWSTRTTSNLSVRVLPKGCGFDTKGCSAFIEDDSTTQLLGLIAVTNSAAFSQLIALQLAAADAAARSYDTGLINQTPFPVISIQVMEQLAELAQLAWKLKRTINSTTEISHAYLLPHALRSRLSDFNLIVIEAELARIQTEIDDIAFDLYGFSEEDRQAAKGKADEADTDEVKNDHEATEPEPPAEDALLSWAAGVVFGRFDWRLATGERQAPPDPEPFDPLPAKSPGMLPDDAQPFHEHAGILVDDEGHPHDLTRLIENVLDTVNVTVAQDVRRWLQKDFFAFHLQRYSKSRRKAPVYWPLSTASGSYTLWVYYPSLNNQTLFTAVNDFVDPKLAEVRREMELLRSKGGGRSQQDEKRLEVIATLEQELADLRDTLLEIAPTYPPNHDDGVQITAAPLWPLFRFKSWQKVLKDTWPRLEIGDYDWSHLALDYWPERVLRKCHQDRSLSIAHGVEADFWDQVEVPVMRRGKDTGEIKVEWQPKDLSEGELYSLIKKLARGVKG